MYWACSGNSYIGVNLMCTGQFSFRQYVVKVYLGCFYHDLSKGLLKQNYL